MLVHMMRPATDDHAMHQRGDDDAGMAGLVIGVEVTGPEVASAPPSAIRRLSMVLNEEPDRYGKGLPGYRVDLRARERRSSRPVQFRVRCSFCIVASRPRSPSSIAPPGRPRFTGMGSRSRATSTACPASAVTNKSWRRLSGPASHFVVKMTPPRSGTFIYHTHWHDVAQLAGGLYSPLRLWLQLPALAERPRIP